MRCIGGIFVKIILGLKFCLISGQIRSAFGLFRNGSRNISGSIPALVCLSDDEADNKNDEDQNEDNDKFEDGKG